MFRLVVLNKVLEFVVIIVLVDDDDHVVVVIIKWLDNNDYRKLNHQFVITTTTATLMLMMMVTMILLTMRENRINGHVYATCAEIVLVYFDRLKYVPTLTRTLPNYQFVLCTYTYTYIDVLYVYRTNFVHIIFAINFTLNINNNNKYIDVYDGFML